MAEYQVPQFIEVEDKVFGPLTLKQFIYIAGGVGLCVILVLYLHFIGIIFAIPVAAFAAALAFYKLNGKSFTDILEAAFNYVVNGRLYLWKKDEAESIPVVVAPVQEVRQKLGVSHGKLHDLAWSLDIKDQQIGGESDS